MSQCCPLPFTFPASTLTNAARTTASSWRRALLVVTLASFRVGAIDGPQGPFTVKLNRQQIPLHSTGGIVHHKSAYHGQLSIGGPQAQSFEVVFDTGSGHLVIPSTMCRAETCRKHRRYRRRSSLLAEDIDVDGTVVNPWQARDQITVSFGTGEVTGIFVHDLVCLGPPEPRAPNGSVAGSSLLQKTTLHVQRTEEVTEVENSTQEESQAPASRPGCVDLRLVSAIDMTDDPFSTFDFDGVLGLGLPSLSQTPEFNFVEAAAKASAWGTQEQRANKLFAVFLAVSDGEESEITFGGWRPERMPEGSALSWCDARDESHGHWQLDVVGILAGGEKVDFCSDGRCRAVVDTGTSLLGVPSALGPELVALLRHPSAHIDGSCGGPGPTLEIDLGNFTIVLDPVDYARPEIVPENGTLPDAAAAQGNFNGSLVQIHSQPDQRNVSEVPLEPESNPGTAMVSAEPSTSNGRLGPEAPPEQKLCVPMLMHIDLPEPLTPKTLILGEPVLQKYYTAFDSSVPRVGFSLARHV